MLKTIPPDGGGVQHGSYHSLLSLNHNIVILDIKS